MPEPTRRAGTRWAAAAGLAAAAVLAVALLGTSETGRHDAVPSRDGAEAVRPVEATADPVGGLAAAPARAPPPAASAPEAPQQPKPPKKPRHAILDVEVVDERGLPASGATVVAYGTFEWDWDLAPLLDFGATPIRAEGTTRGDGRLALEVPVSPAEIAWPGPIVLHAWLGGETAMSDPLDPWAPDPADVGRRAVRLEMRGGVIAQGRVVSDESRPIGGWVELRGADRARLLTKAGDDGSYRFPPVPSALLVDAVLRAEAGDGSATADVPIPKSGSVDVRLVVPEMMTVTGRFVDAQGAPVASVVLEGGWSHGGDFQASVARRGGELLVFPDPPLAGRFLVVRPLQTNVGDVVLERGGRIRGRIEVDGDERLLQRGMGWTVECESLVLGALRPVKARSDGSFEIGGVGTGEHVLRVEWGTHVADVLFAQGEVRGVRAGDEGVVLRVHRCGHLQIDARTADGKPAVVRGWRVEATGPLPEETVTVRAHPDRARDLHDGFEVGLPRPGRYRLRVKIPGFAWAEREEVVSDEEPLVLVVVPEHR